MTTKNDTVQVKNLLLTRTAVGIYGAFLTVFFGTMITLATKYDETGKLKATDWVVAIGTIGLTAAAQLVSLGGRLDPNRAPTYTPRGLPGPNKEDVENG